MIVSDQSTRQILRDAGKIHRDMVDEMEQQGFLVVGRTGLEIEHWIIAALKRYRVEAAFFGQYGFPAHIIVSVNDVVVHGVPMDIPFEDGDVVKIDFGIRYKGYLTDAAKTHIIGVGDPEHTRCIQVAREALHLGLREARSGNNTGDIGAAICDHVERSGFHIIRELTGHGLGKGIHEKPDIFNFGKRGKGERLQSGMYVAIEPIVGFATGKIFDTGNFAICMRDGNIGVQEEHCGIIGDDGFEIIV